MEVMRSGGRRRIHGKLRRVHSQALHGGGADADGAMGLQFRCQGGISSF